MYIKFQDFEIADDYEYIDTIIKLDSAPHSDIEYISPRGCAKDRFRFLADIIDISTTGQPNREIFVKSDHGKISAMILLLLVSFLLGQ